MDTKQYIYGKLNKELEKVVYTEGECVNAEVNIDQKYRTIGINVDLNPVIGLIGEVTILTSDWSETSCTKTFSSLGETDAIFFYPKTLQDKRVMSLCDLFTSAEGNEVTFVVEAVPDSDITLKYYIAKGRVDE